MHNIVQIHVFFTWWDTNVAISKNSGQSIGFPHHKEYNDHRYMIKNARIYLAAVNMSNP